MTTLLIKITPEVLERAKMCGTENFKGIASKNCAIAIAVRDMFPNAAVQYNAILPFGHGTSIAIPHNQNAFIFDFDSLKHSPHKRLLLPPFSFTVELPDEVVERIDISAIYDSQTLELV